LSNKNLPWTKFSGGLGKTGITYAKGTTDISAQSAKKKNNSEKFWF
jgi:hypothetical protein